MKLKIYLTINKYADDGFNFVVSCHEYDYYRNSEDYRFIGEMDVDFSAHSAWLAKAANRFAAAVEESLKAEYNSKLADLKEFQAKFLLLQSDQVQPTA